MGRSEIAKKKQQLDNVTDKMITAMKQRDRLTADMEALSKTIRQKKLMQVGEILEDIGILDSYDKDKLYLLVSMHKQELMKG